MPTDYHHGARVTEDSDAPLSLQTVSTSAIGLVATAEDADSNAFPLNTPVLLTQPADAIAHAGKNGTLSKALSLISNQVTTPTIVVRVPDSDDPDQRISNTIGGVGSDGRYTGLWALRTAEQKLGIRPRILGMPGLESEAATTAMVSVAQALRGFVYAKCSDSQSISDALTYRKQFGARELMLLWPDFQQWDTTANQNVDAYTAAIALGLRAKLDKTVGWHKVLSNVPVNGVTGISQDVYFDYLATGTDADILNEGGITTLINRNGFRFWGSRTCDAGDFVFETYTRTAQVIADTIGEGVFEYSDKPVHASLIRDIIDSINAKLKQYTTDGQLLGGQCWFDPKHNQADGMKSGRFAISYNYTPVPPLEDLELRQTFTDVYFADLANAIVNGNS